MIRIYIKFRLSNKILFILLLIIIVGASIFFINTQSRSAVVPTEAQDTPGINLPVIMYHGILNDGKYQGKYVISPVQFEQDLANIKKHGYNAVLAADLINYVYNDKELPQNPIIITFDDGYYNNYLYAYPLAKKYGCPFVLSPIGYFSDKYTDEPDVSPYYSNCTWNDLKEMEESGYVEIANHSYNMHSTALRLGIKKKTGESSESYKKIICDDITKAQNRFKDELNINVQTFTYPFGAFCDDANETIHSMGFKVSFICTEKINCITKDKECLYNLGRYLRSSSDNSDDFFNRLDKLCNTQAK